MMRAFVFSLVVLGGSSNIALLAAENWPQWRGPLGTGVAAAGDYPVKFSATEGVAWKAKLPGVGTSTPAVWGDRIFVTCGIKGEGKEVEDGVVCFNMNGKELWRHQFSTERHGKNPHGSGSNPSPATDGENLIVYYKTGTLACLDLAGKEKWKINLQEMYGKDTLWWDLGTSPVLADGRVIVAVMQDGDSYLVAVDLKTGKVAWKEKRQYETPRESDQSYSTPQVVKIGGKDVIVTWGADHLTGHDVATGRQLWECGGFNPDSTANWRTIASPVVSDGIAIVPYGRGEFLTGIRVGGSGDITKTGRIWETGGRGKSSDVPTPVVVGDKAYLLGDKGRIACVDITTGKEIWTHDLPQNRNKFYGSPVLAGDKLYCVREDGIVFVGRVSDQGFEVLADHNDMGGRIIASLVPIRGGLLVRGDEHLFMIGQDAPAGRSSGK
jgi:outer membrane protein assembly factor BamB